jgi:hypothetical protein
MIETVAAVAVPVLVLVALVLILRRDDLRLRRGARRLRQLEHEGIEELRRPDPYPEQEQVEGAFVREPGGERADTRRVLHEELERARDYTRRKYRERARNRSLRGGKGAECLL